MADDHQEPEAAAAATAAADTPATPPAEDVITIPGAGAAPDDDEEQAAEGADEATDAAAAVDAANASGGDDADADGDDADADGDDADADGDDADADADADAGDDEDIAADDDTAAASEAGEEQQAAGDDDDDKSSPAPGGSVQHLAVPGAGPEAAAAAASDSSTTASDDDRPVPPEKMADTLRKIRSSYRRNTKAVTSPLTFSWAFGYNANAVGTVLYLACDEREDVFFVAGHTGVLFNRIDNEQSLLQGHCNAITSCAASPDKRWLATADIGADCAIIIWDTKDATPTRAYFEDQNPYGTAAMAMSCDGAYLITVSPDVDGNQTLFVWDWTDEAAEGPVQSAVVQGAGITAVAASLDHPREFAVTGPSRVLFCAWEHGGELQVQRPRELQVNMQDAQPYQQTLFTKRGGALTTMPNGTIVAWERSGAGGDGDWASTKVVKLMDAGVAYAAITPAGDYLVTGGQDGVVRIFDLDFRLVAWNDHIDAGSISSISFSGEARSALHDTFASMKRTGLGLDKATVDIPDYLLSTTTACIVHVSTEDEEDVASVILQAQDGAVHALATHPFHPFVAFAGYKGLLQIWDYESHNLLCSRQFKDGTIPHCLAFSPDGHTLGVGCTNGGLHLLDAISLRPVTENTVFRNAKDTITKIVFSENGEWFATADADRCVAIYQIQPEQFDAPWLYVGKYRAHAKDITDLLFGTALDSKDPRLLSIGMDRMLVEYDLAESSFDNGIVLKDAPTRIEQSAHPRSMLWYPALDSERFLMTSNSAFKLKLYNVTTKMCRKTVLAPTFGSQIERMAVLPQGEGSKDSRPRAVAFTTADKVGLLLLPVDGNPNNSMAVIAHPSTCGVTNMAVSHDGRYVFTAGGASKTIHAWEVRVDLLQVQARLGGEGITPFLNVLEGGDGGELYKEIEDYFYYAQLKQQGLSSMEERKVSDRCPLEQVPNIMRALGFYPSAQEAQDMKNEIKFSKYVDTNEYVNDVSLHDLIKLYINHRPAFGLHPHEIDEAFENVAGGAGKSIGTEDLLTLLQSQGEHFSEAELVQTLTALLGDGNFAEALPETMDSALFSSHVLGLEAQ